MVAVMTFLGALGAFFFKTGGDHITSIGTLLRTPKIYLGGSFYVVSALINIVLLRYLEYSILYPMTAITYIWSLFLSKWLLKEPVAAQKIAGIILICSGVVLVAR